MSATNSQIAEMIAATEAEYRSSPPHSCGTCCHRSHGDQRLISQCALKIYGYHGVAPRARDFGTKCKAFAMSIAAAEALRADISNQNSGGV